MSKTTQTARLVQVTYIDDGMGRRLVLSRTGQAVAETMPVATNQRDVAELVVVLRQLKEELPP